MSCRKDVVDMAFGARGLCCERLIFAGVLMVVEFASVNYFVECEYCQAYKLFFLFIDPCHSAIPILSIYFFMICEWLMDY